MATRAYEAKLAQTHAEYHGLIDKYNAKPLPTLEALGLEQRTNPWLAAVCYRAAQHFNMGYGGVDMIVREGGFGHGDDAYMLDLDYDDLVGVIPHVRRLGYTVTIFSDHEVHCHAYNCPFGLIRPFSVGFGKDTASHLECLPKHLSRMHLKDTASRLELHARLGRPYSIKLHGTSPAQIRRRGLVKCVPRLLGWLRQARIVLADPRRAGALEALETERNTELADLAPPHWETTASVQGKRKRELVDALHASDCDVQNGARWSNIQERGKVKMCRTTGATFMRAMRIEAIAGDHFIFQKCEHDNYFDVVVLHRDAFEVAPWPNHGFNADGYEEQYEHRYSGCDGDASDDD